MKYRAAATSDLPDLLHWMADFNRIEGIPWRAETARPALENLLTKPEVGTVGRLEHDGNGVGYFVLSWGYDLEWDGRDAFLTELYLTEVSRGQGLGKRAIAVAQRVAEENGARAMHLLVRPENASARSIYEGAGFKVSPRLFLTKRLP